MKQDYEVIYNDYMSHFSKECMELLIYNERDFNKSCNFYKELIEQHFNNYIAYIDVATGELVSDFGMLVVPVDKKKLKHNKKCKLKRKTIYRVLVKKCISDEFLFKSKNRYMLVKILEKNVKNDEMESAAREALAPFTMYVEGIGALEWGHYRGFCDFQGDIKWCSESDTIEVQLESDEENNKTADKAVAILKQLVDRQYEWNECFLEAVAEHCTEADGQIHTWEGEEGDTVIDRARFKERLSIGYIHIARDGELSIDVELDDMFTDHAMTLTAYIDGRIEVDGLIG